MLSVIQMLPDDFSLDFQTVARQFQQAIQFVREFFFVSLMEVAKPRAVHCNDAQGTGPLG